MNRKSRLTLLPALLATTALLSLASGAEAATIAVGTTTDVSASECTLRNAITAANTNAMSGACTAGAGSIDVIDLTSLGGTITLGSALPDITSAMSLQGPGAGALQVSGNDSVRVFRIVNGATAMSGLTVAHGRCSFGCGIQNNNSTLTLDGVTVDHNVASVAGGANAFPQGGGIVNNNGDVTLTLSTVSNNSAKATGATGQNAPTGGGIYNQQGTIRVVSSTISGNDSTAVAGAGGSTNASGGGISNQDTLNVLRSTISGNSATASGAGNNAANGGGVTNSNSMAVHVTIDGSTVSGNAARATGGSFNSSQAGGFNVYGASFALTSSTISGNSATVGANLQIFVMATAKNTIISNPLGGGADCSGTLTSQGFNLTDGAGCGFTQAGDRQNTDPLLDPNGLADNGGPTRTITPLARSLAIDGGLSSTGESIDQRGAGRPYDSDAYANVTSGDGTDIGAVEVQAPPETSITSGPADETVTRIATQSIEFNSSEARSTFECAIDGGGFSPCSSPFTTSQLSDGQHTFAVRAVDAAEGPDATPASRSFRVDTAAPQTTIKKGPKRKITKSKVKFTFGGSEAGSTYECKLDKSAFAPCSSPLKLKHVKPGKHVLSVRAVDAAGNVDATPAKQKFKTVKKART